MSFCQNTLEPKLLVLIDNQIAIIRSSDNLKGLKLTEILTPVSMSIHIFGMYSCNSYHIFYFKLSSYVAVAKLFIGLQGICSYQCSLTRYVGALASLPV